MTGWQDTFFTVKPWKTILIEHFCKWFQRVIYGSTRIPDCLIFRQLKQEFKQSLFASLGGKSINMRPGDHWVPEKLPWIVMLASKLQQAEPVRPAKQLHACCREAEAESLSRVITGIFFLWGTPKWDFRENNRNYWSERAIPVMGLKTRIASCNKNCTRNVREIIGNQKIPESMCRTEVSWRNHQWENFNSEIFTHMHETTSCWLLRKPHPSAKRPKITLGLNHEAL